MKQNTYFCIIVTVFIMVSCQQRQYINDICSSIILYNRDRIISLNMRFVPSNSIKKALFSTQDVAFMIPNITTYQLLSDSLKKIMRKGEIVLPDSDTTKWKRVFIEKKQYQDFCKKYQTIKQVYMAYCDIEGNILSKKYSKQTIDYVLTYFADNRKIIQIDDRTGLYYVSPLYFKLNHQDSLFFKK